MDKAIRAVAARILDDPRIPDSVKGMTWLHFYKPWISGFRAVLIAPLKPGLEKHLAAPAGDWMGRMLYVPSAEFWTAHARSSHPPMGDGCSAEAHAAFLTTEGSNREFAYYNLMRENSIRLLGPGDFEEECRYWERVFPGATERGAAGAPGAYGAGPYGAGRDGRGGAY